MALPKQAQEQVAEANRILDMLNTPPGEEPEAAVPPVETPELAVVEGEPPVDGEPTVVVEDAPPIEEPPAPPSNEVVAEDKGAVEPPAEDWEQKYKILQGKYDAEVPQLHGQVRDMNRQMDELKELITSIKEPAAPDKTESTYETPALVTAEEVEMYGADLIDVVARKAKEVYEPTIKSLQDQVADLKSQLGGVSQKVVAADVDKVHAKLDEHVEDWMAINESQDFLDWLSQSDPYSGAQRGKMLREAYERQDADRVLAFFTGFKNEHAAVAPEPDPAPAVPPEAGTPAVDLSTQVAPGRAARTTTPASAQAEKRIWTRAQIVEFYKDCQLGKFKNDPQKREQIERDIFAAQSEGRIK